MIADDGYWTKPKRGLSVEMCWVWWKAECLLLLWDSKRNINQLSLSSSLWKWDSICTSKLQWTLKPLLFKDPEANRLFLQSILSRSGTFNTYIDVHEAHKGSTDHIQISLRLNYINNQGKW